MLAWDWPLRWRRLSRDMTICTGVARETALDIQSHAGCTASLGFVPVYFLAAETTSLARVAGLLCEIMESEPSRITLDWLGNQIACFEMLQSPEGEFITNDIGQSEIEVMIILHRLEVNIRPRADGHVFCSRSALFSPVPVDELGHEREKSLVLSD